MVVKQGKDLSRFGPSGEVTPYVLWSGRPCLMMKSRLQ